MNEEETKELNTTQDRVDDAVSADAETQQDKHPRHRKEHHPEEEEKKLGWWGRLKQQLLRGDNESEDPEERSLRDVINQIDGPWLLRQVPLMLAFFLFGVLSITARYAKEEKQIRINMLQKEVADYRYRALTRSSQLTERTRQSRIEERLKAQGDSTLLPSSEAPFIIPRRR